MEMYASSQANLTLKTQNNFRDVSFSAYLNKTDENMVRKITNQASELPNKHHHRMKSEGDEEIGVFGAEKYFKGEIEAGGNNNNDLRFIDGNDTTKKMHLEDEKVEEFDNSFPRKITDGQTNMHTPSVRSNASCNSRSSLLPRNGSKARTLLTRFGCNCMDKKSTQIKEKRLIHPKSDQTNMRTPSVRPNVSCKTLIFDQKTDQLSTKLAETKPRNDYFSFPVLNPNDQNSNSSSNSNSKSANLAGKVQVDNNNNSNNNNNNGGRLSLGKKLSLLNNWEMDIQTEDEMYISSSRMYNNEGDSDSSSDLFEIESFSPAGDGSFLGYRKTESDCYAPSEVSIEWSVVTASAADFSVVSDYEDLRTGGGGGGRRNSGKNGYGQVKDNKDEIKKRPGILSGCASHKAVRVAGDEYKVGGGGAGGRRRLSEKFEPT